jgi:hypothetical protein
MLQNNLREWGGFLAAFTRLAAGFLDQPFYGWVG